MQAAMFIVMLLALGYNAYGIMQVGIAHATPLQWVFTIAMLVVVLHRIYRMMHD